MKNGWGIKRRYDGLETLRLAPLFTCNPYRLKDAEGRVKGGKGEIIPVFVLLSLPRRR